MQPDWKPLVRSGGFVYGLVSDVFFATKIAKAGQECHLVVHNFDRADALLVCMKNNKPILVILDWIGCEAEAFKYLKEAVYDDDLKKVGTIGYYLQGKSGLTREDAQRAGCDRVYAKSEFLRDLNAIMMRYAQ